MEDIGGTVSDPVVSFKIIGEDEPFLAQLYAKQLSANEKLSLQAGTMMKVRVAKVEGIIIINHQSLSYMHDQQSSFIIIIINHHHYHYHNYHHLYQIR